MCVCLVVTGFVMFCAFSGLVGWLCQLPFLFPGVPSMSNTPESNFKLGGNLTEWHSTGLSPGSVPSLAFFLSISSTFFSARSMCLCLVVTGFVMFCAFSGLVGWLCQLPFLFPGVPSMSNTPESNFKLGGNLTEWHSTGLSPGSVPSLAFFLSISSTFFSARSMCLCLVVTGFVMFCAFSGLVGWLCQLPFLFPGVPSTSNTPKIISHLGEISWNGIPLGSLLEVFPAFAFFLSISSTFFSARSMCLCLVVTGFVMLSIFWAGWVVVSAAFLVSRGSEHVEYPENNFKLGGNLTEWHSTGLSPGSVPSFAFFVSISSTFFSARSMCLCLVVTGFVMFCAFSGLVGWLCQLPFLFPGVPSMSNTPKIISHLGEISWNGIPLGSLLEVFPALHFSFLFLQPSFQQEACVYVWLSLVSSCCLFSGLVGWLCQLPFLFPGVPSMSNTPRITSNLEVISRNGIPLGSLLEVFPALHSSFLFLQPSFQQEACVYVWLSLVLSCFVHFLGWLGGCVSCLFCFQGFRARRIPPK